MTSEMGPSRILVADRYFLFREAVKAALEEQTGIVVVAEAATGDAAVRESNRTQPDIVLIDGELVGCAGIEAARRIKRVSPRCRVLILSDRADMSHLIAALDAGADGYLTKDCSLKELLGAMAAVASGETSVPGRMLGDLLLQLMHRREPSGAHLTAREREVLQLLAKQADKEAIARSLVVSTDTVRTHLNNLFGKLGVRRRHEEFVGAPLGSPGARN
jgi:DNA-binding NarL/FixJ family response regulator